MATSQVKALLDELTAVLAEMGALEETVPEGEQMSDESVKQMETLSERAAKIKGRIEFHEKMEAKQKELRSVLDRGAPAVKPKAADDADARQWCKDHDVRAQSGSVNQLGGALVPPEFATEVIRLLEEYGVYPADAKNRTMTSDQMFLPRRAGGLTAVPIGENDTPTESQITYNQVELVAKLWGIGNRTPNSLIEDSPISLADELTFETAYAFSQAFDDAGFIGDGGPSYHGTVGVVNAITNVASNKGVYTAGTGRNTFDTLTLADFTALMARLPRFARRNAKWYISPSGWAASMGRLSVSQNGTRKEDVATAMPESFLGYPVRQVVSMVGDLTGTGGQILCLFGDLSQSSTFGIRRQVSIKTSADRYMEYDQTFTFATARASTRFTGLLLCGQGGSDAGRGQRVIKQRP